MLAEIFMLRLEFGSRPALMPLADPARRFVPFIPAAAPSGVAQARVPESKAAE